MLNGNESASHCWRSLVTAAATLGLAISFSAAAGSATSPAPSANWAGYVLSGQATTFTSATATWKQPVARCNALARGSAAAFWVGLGGAKQDAPALEQVGTASRCTASGVAYSAWYQVVPGRAVDLELTVRPNDVITASVNVLDGGGAILFQLKNRTLGTVATTQVAASRDRPTFPRPTGSSKHRRDAPARSACPCRCNNSHRRRSRGSPHWATAAAERSRGPTGRSRACSSSRRRCWRRTRRRSRPQPRAPSRPA